MKIPRHVQRVYDAAMAYLSDSDSDGCHKEIEEITDDFNALEAACVAARKAEKKNKVPPPARGAGRRG